MTAVAVLMCRGGMRNLCILENGLRSVQRPLRIDDRIQCVRVGVCAPSLDREDIRLNKWIQRGATTKLTVQHDPLLLYVIIREDSACPSETTQRHQLCPPNLKNEHSKYTV